jgi:glyoxylase-like metal-dependent hydrolase (beta-lactamase superfamily II)
MPAYGHTPGHTVYAIESQGKKLLLVGDTLHIGGLQFADPTISMKFDSDIKQALAERKKIFKEAASGGYLIGAAHLPFPGIGHVEKAGAGYRYLSIPYSPVQ